MKFVIFARKEVGNKISIWARGHGKQYCLFESHSDFYIDTLSFGSYTLFSMLSYGSYGSYAYHCNASYGSQQYLFLIKDYDMLVKKMIDVLKLKLCNNNEEISATNTFNKKFKNLKKVYVNI